MTKTPEHFAAARAAIEGRRAQMIADHQTALAFIDADLAAYAAAEQIVEDIAKRYPASLEAPAPAKKRSTKSGPHTLYTPAEEAMIAAACRGQLKQLAKDIGHSYSGVSKKHEELSRGLKRRRRGTLAKSKSKDKTPATAAIDAIARFAVDHAASAEVSSEAHVAEPDPAPSEPAAVETQPSCEDYWIIGGMEPEAAEPAEASEASEVLQQPPDIEPEPRLPPIRARRGPVPQEPPVQPERVAPEDMGRTITGRNLDNGPEDRRVYDHPHAYTWQGRE